MPLTPQKQATVHPLSASIRSTLYSQNYITQLPAIYIGLLHIISSNTFQLSSLWAVQKTTCIINNGLTGRPTCLTLKQSTLQICSCIRNCTFNHIVWCNYKQELGLVSEASRMKVPQSSGTCANRLHIIKKKRHISHSVITGLYTPTSSVVLFSH